MSVRVGRYSSAVQGHPVTDVDVRPPWNPFLGTVVGRSGLYGPFWLAIGPVGQVVTQPDGERRFYRRRAAVEALVLYRGGNHSSGAVTVPGQPTRSQGGTEMPKYRIEPAPDGKPDIIHTVTCDQAPGTSRIRALADAGGRVIAKCCNPTFLDAVPGGVKKAAPAKTAAKKAPTPQRARINAKVAAKKAAPAKKATAKKAPAKKATTAKKASSRKPAEPKIPDVAGAHKAIAAGADPHPGRRAELADAESKAARDAKRDGQPKPPTPNADFVQKEYADGIDANARKGLVKEYEAALRGEASHRGRPAPTVRYLRNGKAMPDSQNRFSSLAYYFTRDVGKERPRMPAKELRDMVIAKCKVTDVENEAWTIDLGNGNTLAAEKITAA